MLGMLFTRKIEIVIKYLEDTSVHSATVVLALPADSTTCKNTGPYSLNHMDCLQDVIIIISHVPSEQGLGTRPYKAFLSHSFSIVYYIFVFEPKALTFRKRTNI